MVVSHTTFPQEKRRGNNVLTSYLQDFINNAVTANIIPTDSQHRYECESLIVVNSLNLSGNILTTSRAFLMVTLTIIVRLPFKIHLSRISWPQAIYQNLGSSQLLHSSQVPINNMSYIYNIRNATELPLTFLEIQVSHKLCINPKSLIISSKHTFQFRDAYSSPQKDCQSFAYLLASFRIDKTFWLYHIQPFLKKKTSRKQCF